MKWKKAGVFDKTALVFGRMDEPPGTRLRIAARPWYFRDNQHQDVLLFIVASSASPGGFEVSTLLVTLGGGFKPNLADEMGHLRVHLSTVALDHVCEAILRSTDDYTDPAGDDLRSPGSTTELSRESRPKGITRRTRPRPRVSSTRSSWAASTTTSPHRGHSAEEQRLRTLSRSSVSTS